MGAAHEEAKGRRPGAPAGNGKSKKKKSKKK